MSQPFMTEIHDREFNQVALPIDGYHFVNCFFKQSKLIYRGEVPVSFAGCTFINCDWSFEGPAENTLQFLADLHTGLGLEGKQLVESVFSGIRRGQIRDSPIPIVPLEHVGRGVGK